jgi:hypothetical protein
VYAREPFCLFPLFKNKRRKKEKREEKRKKKRREKKRSEEERESVRSLGLLPPSAPYLTFRTPIPEF